MRQRATYYQRRRRVALASEELSLIWEFSTLLGLAFPYSPLPMAYRETPNQDPTPEPELVVAVYDAPHEAHLAILHLETIGIPARTLNELVVGMAPHLGGGGGGIQVLVCQELAEE